VIGAIIVAVIAGAITLVDGQIAFATVRVPLIPAVIALLFAVPAAIAFYRLTLGFAHIGVPTKGWREAFASSAGLGLGAHDASGPTRSPTGRCGRLSASPADFRDQERVSAPYVISQSTVRPIVDREA